MTPIFDLTLKEARAQARRVSQRMQKRGISLTLSQALEAVAAVHGAESWKHLSAQLTASDRPARQAQASALAVPPEPPTLHIYTVSLYRRHAEGEARFEAQTSVLCHSEAQAQDFVLEEYWHPQYDSAGFYPAYEVEVAEFLGMPYLELVAEWLAVLTNKPGPDGLSLCGGIWNALVAMGATQIEGDGRYDPEQLEVALLQAASHQVDAAALFDQLYAALPDTELFMAPAECDFEGSDESVVFAHGKHIG